MADDAGKQVNDASSRTAAADVRIIGISGVDASMVRKDQAAVVRQNLTGLLRGSVRF
ncbi:hypothetical protein [Stenotrophomonas sp.]|uniref:hypothetical protein n=1 Tax=Stenotrophomonas sp. TaxID=69392 RepID=UPI0028A9F593|nr:hypothetical protein [Stenotrophomonas sp.]